MKPNTAVLIAGNENIAYAIANVIIGLKRYNEEYIEKIFVYCDFEEKTRKAVLSIWPEKVELISYALEQFQKDLTDDHNIVTITNRYAHFIYTKAFLFKHLIEYDYVIWLDSDVLILDNIASIFPTKTQCRWKTGSNRKLESFLDSKKIIYSRHELNKPNGGVICLSREIISGTPAEILFREYLDIVKDIFKFSKEIITESDEIPLGVLALKYKWTFEPLDKKANVEPHEGNLDSCIIHTIGLKTKYWNSYASFMAYQEWYINHKIWLKKSGQEISLPVFKNNPAINFGALYRNFSAMSVRSDFGKIVSNVFSYIDPKFTYQLCESSDDYLVFRILEVPNLELRLICSCYYSSSGLNQDYEITVSQTSTSIIFDGSPVQYRVKCKSLSEFEIKLVDAILKCIYPYFVQILRQFNFQNKGFGVLTFHKNVFCYRGSPIFAEFTGTKLKILVKDSSKITYLTGITDDREVKLALHPQYLVYEISPDGQIAIRFNSKYLSCDPKLNLSLKINKKTWEQFTLIDFENFNHMKYER